MELWFCILWNYEIYLLVLKILCWVFRIFYIYCYGLPFSQLIINIHNLLSGASPWWTYFAGITYSKKNISLTETWHLNYLFSPNTNAEMILMVFLLYLSNSPGLADTMLSYWLIPPSHDLWNNGKVISQFGDNNAIWDRPGYKTSYNTHMPMQDNPKSICACSRLYWRYRRQKIPLLVHLWEEPQVINSTAQHISLLCWIPSLFSSVLFYLFCDNFAFKIKQNFFNKWIDAFYCLCVFVYLFYNVEFLLG